jgi:hypothetical protein
VNTVSEPIVTNYSDKLDEITDALVLDIINPILEKNRVLEAVGICIDHYSSKYSSMTFKDWFALVDKLYKTKEDQS